MVSSCQGYSRDGEAFIPLYKDGDSETSIRIGTKQRENVNNNSVEVCILPHQELGGFIRRLVLVFLVIDTLLMVTLISFLYLRIIGLETESSRLTLLTLQSETRLLELLEEMDALKKNSDEYWNLDCSIDFNSTGANEEELEFYLNEPEENEKEGENDDVIGLDGNRRKMGPEDRDKTTENIKRKQSKNRRPQQRKRFVCHEINVASGRRNQLHNQMKKFNGSFHNIPTAAGLKAIHFTGALPHAVFPEGGTIGPWTYAKSASTDDSKDFQLQFQDSSVLVLNDGYYFIYAQVYYLSQGESNSYTITLRRDEASEVLATCSNAPSDSARSVHEQSCFTATVWRLQKGDRLQLTEREMNRLVLLRPGQTYFGLIKLSPLSVAPSSQPESPVVTVNINTTSPKST